MDEAWRENKWKDRPSDLYPNVSCKDAPVPPALPIPNCDCGKPAQVTQSMHPDTAARAYYTCSDYRGSEKCYFFQWIDGPEMVDKRILHFKRWGTKPYDRFQRWVPPPPNPPPMTAEEKKEATARRMANPSLCNCGVPAVIHRMAPGSPYTPTFQCSKTKENGYPLCDFSEYVYGPKSYWPEETTEKEKQSEVIIPSMEKKCRFGVVANHGLVPSELGIGYYCGHMLGDNLATKKCDWEYYLDKREVEDEILRRKKPRMHPNVLRSYIKCRKEDQRKLAKQMRLFPRPGGASKDKTVSPLVAWWENKKRKKSNEGTSANSVELETMKELVANLPVIVPDGDDDE
ncbi:unnamed protein product [Urochloa humidicola]